jgi:thimet oligopeptidase
MDHDNAVTFFHEFGHLLHHILGGKQHWVEQSGIATEWDFIEVPSQLLEEWAWDYNVLKDFAKNEKGESIPEDLVQKMNQANSFGKGLFVNQQMFYAALSLYYHHCFTKPQEQEHTTCTPAYIQSQDTLDALIKLQQEYSPYDYTENTHFQTSFGHLEGYSALYYTYMWSFAIVMDLFDQFKVFENIMSEQAIERAREYRIKVLEAGGSNKAQNLLEAFIPDYDINAHTAFEKWLSLK